MTVVTKPISQEKKDEKPEQVKDVDDEISDVTVSVSYSDNQSDFKTFWSFLSSLSMACLFCVGVIAILMGIAGAAHLFQTFGPNQYVRGVCRLPFIRSSESTIITGDILPCGKPLCYGERIPKINLGSSSDFLSRPLPAFAQKMFGNPADEEENNVARPKGEGGIELDYEIDLNLEEFESLQMPEIFQGRYLHDFKVNKTAIIDTPGRRCFVMPLNREEISPPRSLMDVISKLKNGAFELNLDEIRHQTKVVLPPLASLDGYGFFITKSCSSLTSYRLEDADTQVFKRSAEESVSLNGFVEFAGKTLIRYDIVNLRDVRNLE